MFRYIYIVLREFQSCTLLKLRSFCIIKISLKTIIMWLLIKCGLNDFYIIICSCSIVTWWYMQSGYSTMNKIKFKIM